MAEWCALRCNIPNNGKKWASFAASVSCLLVHEEANLELLDSVKTDAEKRGLIDTMDPGLKELFETAVPQFEQVVKSCKDMAQQVNECKERWAQYRVKSTSARSRVQKAKVKPKPKPKPKAKAAAAAAAAYDGGDDDDDEEDEPLLPGRAEIWGHFEPGPT
jgi:hypothetical protein